MTDSEKKDIYGDKERYLKFKEESSEFGIPDISKTNSKFTNIYSQLLLITNNYY